MKRNRNCIVTRNISGPCSSCGRPIEDLVHTPKDGIALYHPECCPICGRTVIVCITGL